MDAERMIQEASKKLEDRFKAIEKRLDNQYEKTEELIRRVAALERAGSTRLS